MACSVYLLTPELCGDEQKSVGVGGPRIVHDAFYICTCHVSQLVQQLSVPLLAFNVLELGDSSSTTASPRDRVLCVHSHTFINEWVFNMRRPIVT
jgi:hypothetical protein